MIDRNVFKIIGKIIKKIDHSNLNNHIFESTFVESCDDSIERLYFRSEDVNPRTE